MRRFASVVALPSKGTRDSICASKKTSQWIVAARAGAGEGGAAEPGLELCTGSAGGEVGTGVDAPFCVCGGTSFEGEQELHICFEEGP
jgi:hypothetical protein